MFTFYVSIVRSIPQSSSSSSSWNHFIMFNSHGYKNRHLRSDSDAREATTDSAPSSISLICTTSALGIDGRLKLKWMGWRMRKTASDSRLSHTYLCWCSFCLLWLHLTPQSCWALSLFRARVPVVVLLGQVTYTTCLTMLWVQSLIMLWRDLNALELMSALKLV